MSPQSSVCERGCICQRLCGADGVCTALLVVPEGSSSFSKLKQLQSVVKVPNESQHTGFFQMDQIALNKTELCYGYVHSHAHTGMDSKW